MSFPLTDKCLAYGGSLVTHEENEMKQGKAGVHTKGCVHNIIFKTKKEKR